MAVVDLRPALGGDLGFGFALAIVQQRLVADLLERAGNAAILVVPAAIPVRVAGETLLERLQAAHAAGRARRGDGSRDAFHEAGVGRRPLERLEAPHRRANHGDEALQSERIDQQLLAGHHVAQGNLGKRRAIGLAGAWIGAVGAGAAMRRAQGIHGDDEMAVGVDGLAWTDQPVEPAGRPLGDAAALLAGQVLACSVMGRRVAVHDENGVVLRRRRRAVGFVGEFEHGQDLTAFQPEIAR